MNLFKIQILSSITNFRELKKYICEDLEQILHVSKTGQPQFGHAGPYSTREVNHGGLTQNLFLLFLGNYHQAIVVCCFNGKIVFLETHYLIGRTTLMMPGALFSCTS